MLSLSSEELEKWKISFAQDGITYKTDEEYIDAASNLLGFFEILIEMDRQQKEKPLVEDNDPRPHLFDDKGTKIIL